MGYRNRTFIELKWADKNRAAAIDRSSPSLKINLFLFQQYVPYAIGPVVLQDSYRLQQFHRQEFQQSLTCYFFPKEVQCFYKVRACYRNFTVRNFNGVLHDLLPNFIEIELQHGCLLQICCIFPEHLSLRIPVEDCFCTDTPTKKNNFKVAGKMHEDWSSKKRKIDYPIAILTKLREAIRFRKEKTTELLSKKSYYNVLHKIQIHYAMKRNMTFWNDFPRVIIESYNERSIRLHFIHHYSEKS